MLAAFGLARCGFGLPLQRHLAAMLAPAAALRARGQLEAFVEQLRSAKIDFMSTQSVDPGSARRLH